jgi:hypothetical protein
VAAFAALAALAAAPGSRGRSGGRLLAGLRAGGSGTRVVGAGIRRKGRRPGSAAPLTN